MINERFDNLGLLSEGMRQCGMFVNVIRCVSCDTKHFGGYNRCKSKYCYNCSRVRTLLWLSKLAPVIKDLVGKGYYVTHWVFTIRNEKDLGMMYKKFGCYFDKLRKRKSFRGIVKGYLLAKEVTYNFNSFDWHLHMHMLVVHDYGKHFDIIKNIWKEITCGNGSVFMSKVNGVKGIIEVIKYITKLNDIVRLSDERILELYGVMKKKRAIQTAGLLKVVCEEEIEKEMDYIEEKKLIEFICRKCGFTEGELVTYLYDDVRDQYLYDPVR